MEVVKDFTPDYTSEITGVSPEKIIAAEIYGKAPNAILFFARGIEQQVKGVDNVSRYINKQIGNSTKFILKLLKLFNN